MRTMESLVALVGQPVASDAVQAVVASDKLMPSSDEFEEGEGLRHYLSAPTAGYHLTHVDGRVTTVFLYLAPGDGFGPFGGPLVAGLAVGVTRAGVRERLGPPSRSGDGTTIVGLGRQGPWDRWDAERVCLHFQYTEPEQRVRLITVMAADSTP